MRNFFRLAQGVQVDPIAGALVRQPELWNQESWRTTYRGTPHVDVDDILLRYAPREALGDLDRVADVQNSPTSVWYPAASRLPQIKPVVLNLMRAIDAWALERLLVTRIRPGGRILPHSDAEGVYTNSGDIGRYHIVVQGLPGSLFKCGDDTVQMMTGEVWWFNAHQVHEVLNNSADDRIHLIADMRFWE